MTLALLIPLAAALMAASTRHDGLDTRLWSILMDTAIFALLAACVGVVGGYMVGRMGVIWAVLACIPLVIPSSLLGSAWIVALGRTGPLGGWVNIFDWPVAAGAVGLRYVGLAALIFATHRTDSGPAAQIYKLRHAWWWLGVRQAIAPVSAAFVVLFILSSADHIMPSMFLIHTYGTQVLIQYNALQDLPGAAAMAAPMLVPALIGVRVLCRVIQPQVMQESNGPPRVSIWPGLLVLLLAIGVPVAAIIWRTGSWSAFMDSFDLMWPEVLHTGRLALIGSFACTLIAWPMAWAWLARRRGGGWSPVPLVLINLAAPPSMLAIGLIDLSSRWPWVLLRDTDVILYAAYAVRFVPLAVLLLYIAGLHRPELPVAAARLYGVPFSARLRRIHWPRWRGALCTTAALCGLLIATELEVSLLLAPAGSGTVGVRLYTLIHTAPDQQVSAASLAMLVLLTPFIVLASCFIWRRRS